MVHREKAKFNTQSTCIDLKIIQLKKISKKFFITETNIRVGTYLFTYYETYFSESPNAHA